MPRYREGYKDSFSVQEEQRVRLHPDTCPTKGHGIKTLGHEGSGSPLCSLCSPQLWEEAPCLAWACGLSGTLLSTGTLRGPLAHSDGSGVTLGLLRVAWILPLLPSLGSHGRLGFKRGCLCSLVHRKKSEGVLPTPHPFPNPNANHWVIQDTVRWQLSSCPLGPLTCPLNCEGVCSG